ncbi:MAG: molecular chaperone DnaJ [bacterium]
MATGKRDYYDVLGVGRDADADAIKKAYRKLAIQLHPDRNKAADAEDKFKELSEAYAVLSDTDKRARYDQLGHAGIDSQYSADDLYRNINVEDLFGGMGFEDLFSQMFGFGGGRRGGGPGRGRDLQVAHAISLEQALHGTEARIEYWRLEGCETCEGNGAEPGSKVSACTSCGGEGRVQRMVRTPFGTMSQVTTCPTCNGEGRTIEKPCHTCRGTGHERHRRAVTVTIPPGIETGQSLRVNGQGEVGPRGGPYGDLYVQIEVREHDRFHREGTELLTEMSISIPQAVLGAELDLDTFDGPLKVPIPAGSETGAAVRVKGKGMPSLRGHGRGDLHVRLRIDVPDKPSARARELLEELAKELGTEVKPRKRKGFFG